jgi:hypothetical protein
MMSLARSNRILAAVVFAAVAVAACGDAADDPAVEGPIADSPPGDGDAAVGVDAAAPDANANDAPFLSPHPPAAQNGSIAVELGDVTTGALVATDPDGDALTFSIVTPPAHGTLTKLDPKTGAYTYASTGSASGSDAFTFQVTDGTSNAPAPGTVSVAIAPVLFTGQYAVTSVKDNAASCSDVAFRLGHATAIGAAPAYFALSTRTVSCGSTTYTFDPGRFTVSGATSVTDNALTFTQSKSVSGCGTVVETFSLTRTAAGDFDFKEKIQVPCFGVGTHDITGKATRAATAYLFFEPTTASFGRVFQNDPALMSASLRNVGRLPASTLAVSSPAAPFSFNGGAFPGVSGTCGTNVSPLSSCSLGLRLDTSALSPSSTNTVNASYGDGAGTFSESLALSGEVIPKLVNVTEIDAAASYQCAIASGQVVCWGSSGVPTPPNDLVNPRKLTTGSSHACVIDDSGVRCWGSNTSGQLTPPALSNPTSVSAGGNHTCALDATGVHCWGLSTNGQTTVPALSSPTLVSAGSSHTCALDATGVHCWGQNTDGQTTVPALTNPTQVSAGGQYTCALDATGVHCWGNNFANQATPPVIASPTTVVAGGHLSCALAGGALSCWGFFSSGVPKLTGVSTVTTGDHHVCVLIGSSVSCYSSSTRIYP